MPTLGTTAARFQEAWAKPSTARASLVVSDVLAGGKRAVGESLTLVGEVGVEAVVVVVMFHQERLFGIL